MVMMTLYARQILYAKRHRCKEQTFALCAGTLIHLIFRLLASGCLTPALSNSHRHGQGLPFPCYMEVVGAGAKRPA